MEELEEINESINRLRWIHIFLSIIIIGIVIFNFVIIYSNSKKSGPPPTGESQAVEIFNHKFVGYFGEQKGTVVKALYNLVKSINSTDHKITINNKDANRFNVENIKDTSIYMVEGTFDSEDGYLNNILIKKLED